ncbi:unnamed protein product, partial [Rotaria sp. Silwood1]
HALQMSYQSQIWSEIASILQQSQPKLFDSSDNPAEALTIIECAESSISSEFLSSLANSYKNNANHLKTNFSYILIIIERLILKDHIEEASNFIEDTLEVHFTTAVDIDALLRMLIRICPQVNIDHRDQLCSKIIWSLSIKLKDAKCNKQSSSLFFDFALIILNLHFYPWKELASRCSDVIRSCAAYDTISEEEHSRNLDSLEDILRLIAERAQVNPSIIQAIHDEAPRAILRWSTSTKVGNKKTWCSHVYRMEQAMIVFIDQRQVTIDIFAQIIEALQKRIVNDEESDNKEESITSVQVDHLFASIEACPSNLDGLFSTFQALGYVANVQPHLFHKYRAQLLELVTKQQNVWAFGCLQQYFVASTIIGDENTAN